MATYFVFNSTNPQPSAHRVGLVLSTTATDYKTHLAQQYAALKPVAAGDVLEFVPTGAVEAATVVASFSFNPSAPVIPPVGS